MWINKDTWFNELWCGDNLSLLKKFPRESIDLIYIDPPFFSNKNYEIIYGSESEKRAFNDRWSGGIEHFRAWLYDRLELLYSLLKPTGSMYVHLDWHAVHYIKVDLDNIFRGYKHFQREIIWATDTTSGFKSQAKNWIRSHDTILFYTKSKNYTFNKQYLPYDEEYLKRFKKMDESGRKYRDDRPGKRRQYLDQLKGIPVSDVWTDIMSFQQASTSSELVGWPTQKPEALMERIIKASTNEGDLVLDAFCGCGTTIVAAEKLNRRWIGMDISPMAIDVMTTRLSEMEKKQGKIEDFITYGVTKDTIAQLRKMKWEDFEDWVINEIDGRSPKKRSGDFGIDGYTKDGTPIQIKNWKAKVGRPVVFNFEAAIRKEKSRSGKIFAIDFSKDAIEEVARANREYGLSIELIKIGDYLEGKYGSNSVKNEKRKLNKKQKAKISPKNLKITVFPLSQKKKV